MQLLIFLLDSQGRQGAVTPPQAIYETLIPQFNCRAICAYIMNRGHGGGGPPGE